MLTEKITLYDLYDIWYVPLWKHPYSIVLMILIVLIFIFLIKRWFDNKKKRIIVKDPWIEALDQLQKINLNSFQDKEAHKLFYDKLTSILKNYLAKRYVLTVDGKTDQELIMLLARSEFPPDLCKQLMPIIQGAMYVKFADQDAATEYMRQDLMHCIDIIRNTIPYKQK